VTLTRYRKHILEILSRSSFPLKVEDIHSLMDNAPDISTIYRALDYLEKHHMIKGLYYDDNTRYYMHKDTHDHFLCCTSCRRMESFDICIAREVGKILREKYAYEIHDHHFYFLGVCPECQSDN